MNNEKKRKREAPVRKASRLTSGAQGGSLYPPFIHYHPSIRREQGDRSFYYDKDADDEDRKKAKTLERERKKERDRKKE